MSETRKYRKFSAQQKTERHLRRNAVAYLALFVALSGTSYAAAKLPANSVGTTQLNNGAVTSAKINDLTLRASDFATGSSGRDPSVPPARKVLPARLVYSVPAPRRA